ncbi:MAG: flagellar biosynthetic protein FliO [gamma proteobacterium symbiont of Bathyaustriella thionipta]|nr:flagellar biosynthetic protein FliO [gamma proteobacterium symbiont of Bathyaustriella thionipta]
MPSSQSMFIVHNQLKTYWKNTLSILSIVLLLTLQSLPVYANDSLTTGQMYQDTDQQHSESPDKASSEKPKYSFLSNNLFANAPDKTVKQETSANEMLNLSLGLIVILVMIFSLAWLMKKMGYTNTTGQGQLKIIASLNLGQKEKIALIQVGKQQLLVGMTATQINTLHVLDEVIEEIDIKQAGVASDGAFTNKFAELLKHKQSNVK